MQGRCLIILVTLAFGTQHVLATTTSVFFPPGADGSGGTISISELGAADSTTTFQLVVPTGTDADDKSITATYIVSPSEIKLVGQEDFGPSSSATFDFDCHVGADQLATCVAALNGQAISTDTVTAAPNFAAVFAATTSSSAAGSSRTGLSSAPSGTGSGSQSTPASTSGTAPSGTHPNSAVTVGSVSLTSLAIAMLLQVV